MSTFLVHRLANGLTLLGEEMDSVSSAAISVLLPVGSAVDPVGAEGTSNLLSELVTKGAGPYDSRALSDEFEKIGAHHSHSSGIEVTLFSAAALGENIERTLELLSLIITKPRLPDDDLENVRQLALQELKSLEDEPSSKVMVELADKFYPYPFGRSQLGTEAGLTAVNPESLRKFFEAQYVPERVILGVAGKINWERMVAAAERCFGSWKGSKTLPVVKAAQNINSVFHINRDTNQSQIALAYPSVSYDSSDYYAAKIAVGVLSGGMSGRLFVEVREKRGLVYRVSASHSAARGRAAIFCYAGTTPERAQETLDVTMKELRGLRNGVTAEELKRSKADLKSRVVMQGELSSVRASALVNDWWHLDRIRTLDEIKAEIDKVTEADIQRHLTEYPVSPVTLVVLGRNSLEISQ